MSPLELLLISLLAIALLLYQLFSLWRGYRLAIFRHRLFNLRFKLFIYAFDHNLDYRNAMYRNLELHINSFIHFADHLSLTRLVITRTFAKLKPESVQVSGYSDQLQRYIGLNEEDRKELLALHHRMIVLAAQHIIRTYPWWWPLVAVYVLWIVVKRTNTYRGDVWKFLDALDDPHVQPWVKKRGIWEKVMARKEMFGVMQLMEAQAVAFELRNLRRERRLQPIYPY